jgi:hypothetical protein
VTRTRVRRSLRRHRCAITSAAVRVVGVVMVSLAARDLHLRGRGFVDLAVIIVGVAIAAAATV